MKFPGNQGVWMFVFFSLFQGNQFPFRPLYVIVLQSGNYTRIKVGSATNRAQIHTGIPENIFSLFNRLPG